MDPRKPVQRDNGLRDAGLQWLCGCALLLGGAPVLPAQVDSPATQSTTASRARIELDHSPLTVQEQLVLVVSNATDPKGKRREVLVFLSRPKNAGWQAIGATDSAELREHWRMVAKRRLSVVDSHELDAAERRKIDLAIELTISRFLRAYEQLQYELAQGSGGGADLMSDPRFGALRDAGVHGPFGKESVAARVVNTVAARPQPH